MLSTLAGTMFDAYARVARGDRPNTERARALASEYRRSWGLRRSHWAGEVTSKSTAVVTLQDLRALRVIRDLVDALEGFDSYWAEEIGVGLTRPTAKDLFLAVASHFDQSAAPG